MTGPVYRVKEHPDDAEARAAAAWDAFPRHVEPPTFHGSEYTIDQITYHVAFSYNGPMTLCAIVWHDKKGKLRGTQGVTICNPKDAYDQNIGERQSMRRACGIGNEYSWYDLRPLFDLWRKDQRGPVEIPRRHILTEAEIEAYQAEYLEKAAADTNLPD